jgi:hypothetical protein
VNVDQQCKGSQALLVLQQSVLLAHAFKAKIWQSS